MIRMYKDLLLKLVYYVLMDYNTNGSADENLRYNIKYRWLNKDADLNGWQKVFVANTLKGLAQEDRGGSFGHQDVLTQVGDLYRASRTASQNPSDGDLLDMVVNMLRSSNASQIDRHTLESLRRAILLPEERSEFAIKVAKHELACYSCTQAFGEREMATYSDGFFYCQRCRPAKSMKCPKCAEHLVDLPETLQLRLAKFTCKDHAKEAPVDPPEPPRQRFTMAAQTGRVRADDVNAAIPRERPWRAAPIRFDPVEGGTAREGDWVPPVPPPGQPAAEGGGTVAPPPNGIRPVAEQVAELREWHANIARHFEGLPRQRVVPPRAARALDNIILQDMNPFTPDPEPADLDAREAEDEREPE